MKIAMVSEHASPLATLGGVDAGGQNVHVAELARELVRLGHDVTVYTRRESPVVPRRVVMESGVVVEHVEAGPLKPIAKDAIYGHIDAFAARLDVAWDEARPDIVHAHFWMSALAALGPAKRAGIPLVQTFHALGIEKRRHQGDADPSPSTRIDDEARIAREADRIVATTSAEAFALVRMGASQKRLAIVPCGVNLSAFSPFGRCEKRRGAHLRVVTLSRLVPRKGVDTAIEALVNVAHAELVIAGGGEGADLACDPEAQRLSRIATTSGVAARTYLRGRMDRAAIPALLRSADVVVCTPWYEPFGIVPLEAMACGVPVIVSAVGGLIDTVVDGVTGLHVPPRDPAALAGALRTLRDDPQRRIAMGAQAVERVGARYSWARVAKETLGVYASTLGAGSSAADPIAIGG